MAKFITLNKQGSPIKIVEKQFNFKRYSQQCAAQQKFLDSLFTPGATEGRIAEDYGASLHFTFTPDGRSVHYFPES